MKTTLLILVSILGITTGILYQNVSELKTNYQDKCPTNPWLEREHKPSEDGFLHELPCHYGESAFLGCLDCETDKKIGCYFN